MDRSEEVKALQKSVASKKTTKTRLQGRKDSIMDELEKDFKCTKLGDAKTEIKSLEGESDALEDSFDTKLATLKEKYDWGTA